MRNPNGWPRALGVAAAVLFVLALGCGDEGEPTYEPAGWRVGATFDYNTTPMAAEAFADGACYVAGIEHRNVEEEMFAVVYRFDGGSLELAYRAPDPHSTFWCMGAAPDSIWAGGYDHLVEGVSLDPFLVRYDGAAFTEVPCPPFSGMRSVRAVAPVSKNAAFVAFGEDNTFSVYYYENGTWRPCLENLPEMGEISLAATPSGKVFVNCMAEPEKAGAVVILTSQDKGATWHRETFGGAVKSRAFGPPVLAASGETLYVAATFIQDDPTQNVLYILRRDAAPAGEGTYVADFYEADTNTIPEVGALTVGANGNGYAVGRGMGYRRRESGWTRQDFSAMPTSALWDVTGGTGDFWAIGQQFISDDHCRIFVSP